MAGIYIHIPFCKSRCIYCGFFSTTSLRLRQAYVAAVCRELEQRRSYLGAATVDTIYFGGGTPSQLLPGQIGEILRSIYYIYNVRANAEVTVEANPDDITPDFLAELRSVGVNRLSMGVQSFSDERLRFINRRHTARQAHDAVERAQSFGFDNISIDLMFGFPGQTLDSWQTDVDEALKLRVQHLSAYSLQYEEDTLLEKMLSRGDFVEIDEELSLAMYEYLLDATQEAGFSHYEISNFALPGFQSRHNSSYWQGKPYLGVGAGAHSYDGDKTRQYNAENIEEYICGIENNNPKVCVEELSFAECYNEHVFTALRTSEGLDLQKVYSLFGAEIYSQCRQFVQKGICSGVLIEENEKIRLSRKGLFVSNDVMSDFMLVD